MSKNPKIVEQSDTARIYAALDANNYSVKKEFKDLLDGHTYAGEDAYYLAAAVVADIERLTVFGVNNGFNSVAGGLGRLLDLACKIPDARDAKKLEKIRSQYEDVLSESAIAKAMKAQDKTEIKRQVLDRIASSERLLDILKDGLAASPKDKQTSRALLQELSETVDKVWDTSSQSAFKMAQGILQDLGEWRRSAANGALLPKTINNLQNALLLAKNWQQACVFNKKGLSKETRIQLGSDRAEDVVRGEETAQNADVFFQSVHNFADQLKGVGYAAAAEELKALQQELNDLTTERAGYQKADTDNKNAFRNGTIDKNTALSLKREMAQNIAFVDQRINDQRNRIKMVQDRMIRENKSTQAQRIMINNLWTIESVYREAKAMRAVQVIFRDIDFVTMTGLLDPFLSSSQLKELSDDIVGLFVREKVLNQDRTVAAEGIQALLNAELAHEETIFETSEQTMDEELGDWLSEGEEAEVETNETRTDIPLSSDER